MARKHKTKQRQQKSLDEWAKYSQSKKHEPFFERENDATGPPDLVEDRQERRKSTCAETEVSESINSQTHIKIDPQAARQAITRITTFYAFGHHLQALDHAQAVLDHQDEPGYDRQYLAWHKEQMLEHLEKERKYDQLADDFEQQTLQSFKFLRWETYNHMVKLGMGDLDAFCNYMGEFGNEIRERWLHGIPEPYHYFYGMDQSEDEERNVDLGMGN
ncbi:MAG: hypothetical protein Q9186_006319 [Xanthomendoza sp. 1 TL-2023]